MLDPTLYVHGIPGLDEALPLGIYSELSGEDPEIVVGKIESSQLLGAFCEGEWYVEAPPFAEARLRAIWEKTRAAGSPHGNRTGRRDRSADIPAMDGLDEELRYASVLGLKGKVTRAEVKASWRALVTQYHPDKVCHLGPKLREVAEKEMKDINVAYEFFRRKYGD